MSVKTEIENMRVSLMKLRLWVYLQERFGKDAAYIRLCQEFYMLDEYGII